MPGHNYYVYPLATPHNTSLYCGVANDLLRRVTEHRTGAMLGFTRRYHVYKLVYYQAGNDINEAIAREKQIKSWNRAKKISLITAFNPGQSPPLVKIPILRALSLAI